MEGINKGLKGPQVLKLLYKEQMRVLNLPGMLGLSITLQPSTLL